jgi:hypothetical protein
MAGIGIFHGLVLVVGVLQKRAGTRYVFPLLSGKGLGLPRFCRKAAPFRGWSAKRKSSSLRCGIFFCQALRKKAIQGPEAYKIGKTYPDGIIHS